MNNLIFSHGGNIHYMEKKYKRKFLDFSANINPLGLPINLKKHLFENYNNILHYPDIFMKSLINKIADYWDISRNSVLLGNGSIELIYQLMYNFQHGKVIIPYPSFSEYERAARSVNAEIEFLKLSEGNNYQFIGSTSDNADAIFLCNPNNPTGNLVFNSKDIIKNKSLKLIIVDEAFMDFLPDERSHTLISETQKNKKIVVLRSFTKFFALPGLRIGYLIGHQDVINKLKQKQIPWNINSFAQQAAEQVLTNEDYIIKTKKYVEKERLFLFNELNKFDNLKPFPSVTNFLLVKINNKKLTSALLCKKMIENGILLRDCSNFKGLNNRFIRIAVRTHKENLQIIKIFKKIIEKINTEE